MFDMILCKSSYFVLSSAPTSTLTFTLKPNKYYLDLDLYQDYILVILPEAATTKSRLPNTIGNALHTEQLQ